MYMYCITINNSHFEKIKRIGYLPVGLGDNIQNKNFYNDKFGENISKKNPYYGEYTFHYWLWKNEIKNLKFSDYYNKHDEFMNTINIEQLNRIFT